MNIAVTGATGFLGRSIVETLVGAGHRCRCWQRPTSDLGGFAAPMGAITWVPGRLGDPRSADDLLDGCDAVVHAALDHPGGGFRESAGDLLGFLEANFLGTIRLVEQAQAAGVGRFIFISSCAVHDEVLPDRPLDETHPLWPKTHYGAHKAAIEAFVSSFGRGKGFPICSLRPTGIYGLARPASSSKWFDLIDAVARGEAVTCRRGGKEVHASDVARAVSILLQADGIAGQAYACYDRYVSELEVAMIARRLSGSTSRIEGTPLTPRNQIDTSKIRALGMTFGGEPLLEATISEILGAVARRSG